MTVHKICYWCGQPATGKEHVPPENLFPNHKVDLITVDSCEDHNSQLPPPEEVA